MKKRAANIGGNADRAQSYRWGFATGSKTVSPVGLSSFPTVTGGRCSASRRLLFSLFTTSADCHPS